MNRSDLDRNSYMLCGKLAKQGYMRWRHSFSGYHEITGERRTFFVEYLLLNPMPEKRSHEKSAPLSYVRVSAGFFPDETSEGLQLHAYYSVQDAKYARKPLYLQVGRACMSENRISGLVEIPETVSIQFPLFTDAGTMEWNIEINKTIACHTGLLASPLFSALNALDSFWHGEGIRSEMRGTVNLNGEIYIVSPETSYGYADKHWGRAFNRPWLQLSSCHLYSERTGKLLKHSALAVDGCCPRFLWFPLRPKLYFQLTYTGEDFCFSFADALHPSRLKWGTKESRSRFSWRIKAQNRNVLIKCSITSIKREMMYLQYDSPDSDLSHPHKSTPLWAGANGIGSIELYRMTAHGKEWLDTLTVYHAVCEFQKPAKT